MSKEFYLYKAANPLFDALEAITGNPPPDYVLGLYSGAELGDRVIELQDWCSMNARPVGSTGLGILEAAELMVREAVDNANIAPSPREPKEEDEPVRRVASCMFCDELIELGSEPDPEAVVRAHMLACKSAPTKRPHLEALFGPALDVLERLYANNPALDPESALRLLITTAAGSKNG